MQNLPEECWWNRPQVGVGNIGVEHLNFGHLDGSRAFEGNYKEEFSFVNLSSLVSCNDWKCFSTQRLFNLKETVQLIISPSLSLPSSFIPISVALSLYMFLPLSSISLSLSPLLSVSLSLTLFTISISFSLCPSLCPSLYALYISFSLTNSFLYFFFSLKTKF